MNLMLLKIVLGFVVGKTIGTYFAREQLSPMLGLVLVVVLTLFACTGVDYVLE
jgi:hypothetical protein